LCAAAALAIAAEIGARALLRWRQTRRRIALAKASVANLALREDEATRSLVRAKKRVLLLRIRARDLATHSEAPRLGPYR
jgi:hypothetical protein